MLTFVLSALVALALVVIGVPLAGSSEWRTVPTGSMEPVFRPGDVVMVTPSNQLPRIGDVVVFQDPLHPHRDVLHRVVDIDGMGRLVTKGDANDAIDPWTIDPSAVIGRPRMRVPQLGFLVETMSKDAGILVFLALPATFILFSEGRVWYRFVRYGSEAVQGPKRGRHLAEGAT